jgi:CRISPR-associated exonuclease Cas4
LFSEADLMPLSALQHLLFCKRQCALIHVEQQWEENRYTAEGRIMHERVDASRPESRGDVRLEFSVALRSFRLGLIGKADVVEFHRCQRSSCSAPKTDCELWQPFPVEYKRGRPKKENWDKVQLCAQALCLEEMLEVAVPAGALFYGKTRRRVDVAFDTDLRRETENTSQRLHELIASMRTPSPAYKKRCDKCSFFDRCLPKTLKQPQPVIDYLRKMTKTT